MTINIHTLGPWTCEEGPRNSISVIGDNVVVATLPDWPCAAGEREANARLIEQAPRLLLCLQLLTDWMLSNAGPADWQVALLTQAQAAIAAVEKVT